MKAILPAALILLLLAPATAASAEPDVDGAWTGTATFESQGHDTNATATLSLTTEGGDPQEGISFTLMIETPDGKRRISMGRASHAGDGVLTLPERRVVAAEGLFAEPGIAAPASHSVRHDAGPPERIQSEPGAFFGGRGFRFDLTRIVR